MRTAIVHHLKGEQEYESIPTVGFNVETIKLRNIALVVWVRTHTPATSSPSLFSSLSLSLSLSECKVSRTLLTLAR
jgi:hypothetical protein